LEKTRILNFSLILLYLVVSPIRDAENSLKFSFYGFFFVLIIILFAYFGLRSRYELANFYGGVLIAFVLLWVFKALPFIEGWTIHRSYLQEKFNLPFPLHHSTLALLVAPFILLLQSKRNCLPSKLQFRVPILGLHVDLIFLLWGGDLFLFISQVPEIIINRNLFF